MDLVRVILFCSNTYKFRSAKCSCTEDTRRNGIRFLRGKHWYDLQLIRYLISKAQVKSRYCASFTVLNKKILIRYLSISFPLAHPPAIRFLSNKIIAVTIRKIQPFLCP